MSDEEIQQMALEVLDEVLLLKEQLEEIRANLPNDDDPRFTLLHRIGVRIDAAVIALQQIGELVAKRR